MLFLCLVAISFFTTTNCYFSQEDNSDFSKCKVYYTRSQSTYKDFFELADEAKTEDLLLDFHFSVLASSDAHLLFSPSVELKLADSVYEIVLGAGGNSFSDIRRKQKADVKASVTRKGLLSSLDIRSFWIHIAKDGLIEIGKEGEELGFLSWRDPDPLPLKVFSFCTWPGVDAKWLFDCPRENKTSNSTEIEPVLSNAERLRNDLLLLYDPYAIPLEDSSGVIEVTVRLATQRIALDEYKSVIDVQGTATLTWMDPKLTWDPNDYQLEKLNVFKRDIWQPQLSAMK